MAERYLLQPLSFGAARPVGSQTFYNSLAVIEDADLHLRDKVLAVLFTSPGERANRPTFGVGINRAVFEPLDDLSIGALEFRITEGLRRDIGDEIILDGVDLETSPEEGELRLIISYRRREDRVPRNLEIEL